jgi:hypothetical protein
MNNRWSKFGVIVLAVLAASWLAVHRPARDVKADSVRRIIPTGDTLEPRFDHTATLLPNGKVLIAAGMARNGTIEPTAELYDLESGRFTFAGKLTSPRGWGSTATLLRDGKVLITGGASGSWCNDTCYLATAELYDPATAKFTPTGNMTTARAGTRAILLQNGDALIIGGNTSSDSTPAATAELYHASTGTFSVTGTPSESATVLVPLKDGNVLALGGSGAEIYDPLSGRFAPAGKFSTPLGKFGAAPLPDGSVLVAGGQVSGARGPIISSTEIFNPATKQFTAGPAMNFRRYKLMKAVVPLSDGEILIGGGAETPEIYDPAANSFQSVGGSKLDGYCFSTATQLSNGEVLLTGGYNTSTWVAVDHAWLYRP